jgi:hypothetical protein
VLNLLVDTFLLRSVFSFNAMLVVLVFVVQLSSTYYCLALPCLALSCLALPCLALSCLALPCPALPCLALPCLALQVDLNSPASSPSHSLRFCLVCVSSGVLCDERVEQLGHTRTH